MSISKINGETIIAAFGGGYSLRGTLANTSTNPTAGITYYGGGAAGAAITQSSDSRRLYIPKTGTIKSCYGYFNQTASASGNTGTLSINVNNGGYTTISTAAHNVVSTVYSNTSLSISVTQGNYIEFKWTCPATTAPTNMTSSFIIYIE